MCEENLNPDICCLFVGLLVSKAPKEARNNEPAAFFLRHARYRKDLAMGC